eukprot:Plantae.Rhodophyta-Rhodochaete_pulchella.ctg1403.p1 GENE.Plantae.Rhodophyta-Rhodochaete_pulchella.ctg1403~~Plantae.Rhodophyta-Rhodochaete_pulchella.ctg1403.p1  ORF type:complete len:376 (+),score=81.92 Plantae.Rhodophyta-Rhodochaete_pulchella.ctg1403:412-1539(+)
MVQQVPLRHGKPPEMSGWIRKQTAVLSVRKKRYFRLADNTLTCAHDEEETPTWECTMQKARVYGKPTQLKIILALEERSMNLFLNTKEEYEEWYNALLKSSVQNVEEYYELGKVIGEGAFAKVFMGIDKKTLEKHAVKIIEKNQTDPQEIEFINRELEIMRRVDHPNVVKTIDIFDTKSRLYIVMEYMNGGTLAEVFKRKRVFELTQLREIARDLVNGIAYLHEQNIVHRDLKPRNILCMYSDPPLHLKLADFGLSNFVGTATFSRAALQSQVGSPHYVAPEVLREDISYGPAVDMWSVGVILWVLAFQEFPLAGETMQDTLELVAKGKVDFNGQEFANQPAELQALFKCLLRENPRERCSAKEALQHPFFTMEL